MNQDERAVAAGFLACMRKHASEKKAEPGFFESNPALGGLIGAGAGAGIGGIGSYLASRKMYQNEPDPAIAAKKRNRNLILGLLGGGALGGAAGVAPSIIGGVREELDKGAPEPVGTLGWVRRMIQAGAGGVAGHVAGTAVRTGQMREAINRDIRSALGQGAVGEAQANAVTGPADYTDRERRVIKQQLPGAKDKFKLIDHDLAVREAELKALQDAKNLKIGDPDKGVVSLGRKLGLNRQDIENLDRSVGGPAEQAMRNAAQGLTVPQMREVLTPEQLDKIRRWDLYGGAAGAGLGFFGEDIMRAGYNWLK